MLLTLTFDVKKRSTKEDTTELLLQRVFGSWFGVFAAATRGCTSTQANGPV